MLTMRDRSRIMLHMNKLSTSERVAIIRALVEGCSVNSTCRLTGRSIHTVLRLLADIGEACQKLHDEKVCSLLTKRVQCDEAWNFCYCKQRNIPADKQGQFGYGDVWTWVGIDTETKLIITYLVGTRNAKDAKSFMSDVAWRLCRKVQMTTDGLGVYLDAVDDAFGGDIDYAQLIKIYGPDKSGAGRYSPPEVIGIQQEEMLRHSRCQPCFDQLRRTPELDDADVKRRFTRLTNGFSKKDREYETRRRVELRLFTISAVFTNATGYPAMAAGLTDHVWEIEELVGLIS